MVKKSSKAKRPVKKIARRKSAPAAKNFFPLLQKDERYAGILLDEQGHPTAHLIPLPGELDSRTWNGAKAWAKNNGGELPTRQEQALLFANAKSAFQPDWYWSGEQFAGSPDCAWLQNFSNGGQDYDRKAYDYRARAVRRVSIQ